jgi:hypothetical protein
MPPIPTSLPHSFFNEVMRLVVRENHWLLRFVVRKIRLKMRFVETITIPF